jgi:hypothetical protein
MVLSMSWYVEHLSQTYAAQQSVTKIISQKLLNLVTPKAGAKQQASEVGYLQTLD